MKRAFQYPENVCNQEYLTSQISHHPRCNLSFQLCQISFSSFSLTLFAVASYRSVSSLNRRHYLWSNASLIPPWLPLPSSRMSASLVPLKKFEPIIQTLIHLQAAVTEQFVAPRQQSQRSVTSHRATGLCRTLGASRIA